MTQVSLEAGQERCNHTILVVEDELLLGRRRRHGSSRPTNSGPNAGPSGASSWASWGAVMVVMGRANDFNNLSNLAVGELLL